MPPPGGWADLCISIHAPRVGGDYATSGRTGGSMHFNPRPPCGGRRLCFVLLRPIGYFNPRPPCGGRPLDRFLGLSLSLFQSTPLVWGATAAALSRLGYDFYFNPRPPWGGRHHRRIPLPQAGQFQSTPPVWGATLSREAAEKALGISIHAPRVGGDGYTWAGLASAVISIHAPRVGGDPSG